MKDLGENNTWDLVPQSSHWKTYGCRWIYKMKYNANNTFNWYKARLVAKGYA